MIRVIPFALTFFLSVQALSQGLPGRRTMKHNGLRPKIDVPIISGKDQNLSRNINRQLIDPLQKKVVDKELGAVAYLSNPKFAKTEANARKSVSEMGYAFLNSVQNQLRFNNAKEEFKILSESTDQLGMKKVKMQQYYKGIPIYGAEVGLYSNKSGVIEFMMGKAFATPQINPTPKLNVAKAIELAYQNLKDIAVIQKSGLVNKLLDFEPDSGELLVYKQADSEKLIYYLTLRPNLLERWVYFVDANSGDVIEKFNHTCTLDGTVRASSKDLNSVERSFNSYQIGSNYLMMDVSKKMYNPTQSDLPDSPVGAILTIDAGNARVDDEDMNLYHVVSTNPSGWNATAVSAHTNASFCYDYYENTHTRKSLNGQGGNIISVINITDEDGKGFDNAFWNGVFMGYGNGGQYFKPLAGALDVAGHEMTHGVIENTAKLEYRGQSGALNESFADIFGALIDRDDWTMGEDVVNKSIYTSGALRSLQNPNQGGVNDPGYQPKIMSQYKYLDNTPEQDNGGVHINSGIPNYAFYLFSTASGMTKDKAEKVYYRALTNYLGRSSNFQDLRLAVIQSAKDLYGNTEATAAQNAFDQVGITESGSGGSSGGTEVEVNPGAAKIVAFSTPENDQRIYMADFKLSNDMSFQAITDGYGCLSKPSITDDGSLMLFIGNDGQIHVVGLDDFSHSIFNPISGAKWYNVAISKDGNRVAAILDETEDNNYIYVFDLEGQKYYGFELYNPTYSQGVNSGEVQYAEALEWDLSGEYIIYDAQNKVGGWFSDTKYFYDIGLLKAWNASQKTFGDGTVEKIFTNLPEGVSIGNPTFAKTNSNIIAFDYIDNESNYIFTANLGTSGDLDAFEVNTLGFPDFGKTDEQLVFNYINNSDEVIIGVKLGRDKITADLNSATVLADGAAFGVVFAKGTRTLPQILDQTISVSAISDKRQGESFNISATASSGLPLIYTLVSGDATISGSSVRAGATAGKVKVEVVQIGNNSYNPASAETSFCIMPSTPTLIDNGTYVTAAGGSLYQFYINGAAVGAATSDGNLNKNAGGTYSVKTVTRDGCYSQVSNVINYQAVLANENPQKMIKLVPNPVADILKVKLPENEVLVEGRIYDAKGGEVTVFKTQEIGVKSLSSGNYILKVQSNKGNYATKMVKL